MTTPSPTIASDAVEISPPTVQFTTRGQPALVQFHRKSQDGTWKREQFHPTQDELAAHEAQANPGTPNSYWGDDGVEAATIAYMKAEGFLNVVIVDPTPLQPAVPVQSPRIAADGDAASNGNPSV